MFEWGLAINTGGTCKVYLGLCVLNISESLESVSLLPLPSTWMTFPHVGLFHRPFDRCSRHCLSKAKWLKIDHTKSTWTQSLSQSDCPGLSETDDREALISEMINYLSIADRRHVRLQRYWQSECTQSTCWSPTNTSSDQSPRDPETCCSFCRSVSGWQWWMITQPNNMH